ncbi:cell division protein ZipA [Zhongshania sp.]|jgi:cell division protein ZipA|uniref:cell division protein ZipA n=1 Tax=Zhongshania sp. TaxID=1971902 RepID=UPI0039E6F396
MDLNVRDWLIIIGTLLAAAVLLDGVRRMRKDRRDTVRLSSKIRQDDDELSNPELPSGVRVVAVRETPSLHMKRVPATVTKARQEPEFKAQDDIEQVDDLGEDSVKLEIEAEPEDDILFTDPADEYRSKADDDDDEDEVVAGWSSPENDDDEELPMRADSEDNPELVTPATAGKAGFSKEDTVPSEHHELLVINAMAPEGKQFKGNDLLQILMACDVRYGKMSIFHRYENSDGTGQIQFSVANLVEPGNFNLDGIDEFSTPGVVFFMHLPGPRESIKAYEAMVETARCLVKNLEGELRDQTHSVATKQTLEHYKQRIRDFERHQLTLM